MKRFRKMGKVLVAFYTAQAMLGVGLGVYLGATLDPTEIERMVRCVTH